MNLKDKVVVITGSSSGIGRTTAVRFAKEGAKIVVNYHLNEKGANETLQEIQNYSEGIIVKADVSKPEEIKVLFDTIVEKYSTVDILINNAAIPNDRVSYFKASPSDILEMVNTDLIGPMICSQYAVTLMKKQGYGKILNTSSIKGIEYGGHSVVYAASKAGLNSFTKTLAKHVAPEIQVNAVAPGYVKTRSYDGLSQEKLDTYLNQTYLKRWVTEDEIADAFIFLAKNDAMTGQVIYVDAGFTLK